MSAPVESIIAAALLGHNTHGRYIKSVGEHQDDLSAEVEVTCRCDTTAILNGKVKELYDMADKWHAAHQAAAVMAALVEAGTVEWGTWYGPDDVDKEASKGDANYFASLAPSTRHVVSRLTLPWQEVEA